MGEVWESYLGVSELNQMKGKDTDWDETLTSNFDVQMELVVELIFRGLWSPKSVWAYVYGESDTMWLCHIRR